MHPITAGLCHWLTSYCSTRVKKAFRNGVAYSFINLYVLLTRSSWLQISAVWWQRLREIGGVGTGCGRGGCARGQFGSVGRAQNAARCAVDQVGARRGRFHCGWRKVVMMQRTIQWLEMDGDEGSVSGGCGLPRRRAVRTRFYGVDREIERSE